MIINPYVFASAPTYSYLLDTYSGAAAAYSLRKLRSAYTGNCIRVRRSSDNTEQDIGFVNNVLDEASLITFCGSGNGFVTTWYDQSGNANNGVQTTAANQPQIVSSGAMITLNSKNALKFDGSNDSFNLTSTIVVGASSYNSFVGNRSASLKPLIGLVGKNFNSIFYTFGSSTDSYYYLQAKTTQYLKSNAGDSTINQLLLTGFNNAGTMSMFKNSNTIASTVANSNYTPSINSIGQYAFYYMDGNLQEIVFYNSDQSSNRTGIESNINTFYTIY